MTSDKKRLFLIDGSGYIYRAFYALPPMTHPSDKMPVNAVFGFTSMLMNFIKENPHDCMAVVFDTARKNFRNNIFPDYKATRKEVPEDLIPQFPLIRDAVRAFNIPAVEQEGYEADDLIAAYAKKAVTAGYEVVIVSADKDLTQLMDDAHVQVYDPMKKRYVTNEDVMKKFGVAPDKVTQVQALMGDAIDNIPGVKGIGPKTAAELINAYGNLDGVYANLAAIGGRKAELLSQDKERAYMSLKLVTLAQDAPLPQPIESFCCFKSDAVKIQDFLNLMEFKALQGRVSGLISAQKQVMPVSTVLLKTFFTSMGVALVVTSQSFGVLLAFRSLLIFLYLAFSDSDKQSSNVIHAARSIRFVINKPVRTILRAFRISIYYNSLREVLQLSNRGCCIN